MTKQYVFLDANILIAHELKEHSHKKQAVLLLKKLKDQNYIFCTSTLIFDEFWHILIGIYTRQNKFSREKAHKMAKKATRGIFKDYKPKILDSNLKEDEFIKTIDYMFKYRLRPRDASIISIMKKNKVSKIATFDSDFNGIHGIEVLS